MNAYVLYFGELPTDIVVISEKQENELKDVLIEILKRHYPNICRDGIYYKDGNYMVENHPMFSFLPCWLYNEGEFVE